MKEFFINIGGKERRLRYTTSDGMNLYRRFSKPLMPLVNEDLVGLDATNYSKLTRATRSEVQVAFVYLGLAHDMPRLQEEQVAEWFDKHLEAGGDVTEDFAAIAAKAAYYSGIVLGKRLDLDAEKAKVEEQLGEGKPTPAGEVPSPTPAAIPAAE